MIRVEVVHAQRDEQTLVAVEIEEGATVWDAVERSGIARLIPGIDPVSAVVGVFGRVVTGATPLREGDRVEIYRPLAVDPKETRRRKRGQSGKRGAGGGAP